MPLISTSFPNLNGGVSQQPASQRLETQCEAQENALPLVIGGLVKRPPTEDVGELKQSGGADLDLADSFIHFIQRDESEKYVLSVKPNGELRVHGIADGVIKTVTVDDASSTTYLTDSAPHANLRAMTVGDVTWILNKSKTAAMTSATAAANPHAYSALLWIRNSGAGFRIKVTVGSSTAQVEHTFDPSPDSANDFADPTGPRTQDIAEILEDGTVETAVKDTVYTGVSGGLSAISGITVVRGGNVLYLHSSSDFQITVEDSLGDQAHNLIKEEAQDFTDLPGVAYNGQVVKVSGNPESEVDDYFVKFETNLAGTTGMGSGLWVETAEPGIKTTIDPATMPQVLVRVSENNFVLKEADGTQPSGSDHGLPDLWPTLKFTERTTGSNLTNPLPSFVDEKINDMAYFKGRLCFISGENVSLSEAGEFFNFFRTTVIQLLDSAPIDVGVGGTDVNRLTRAVPFSDRLVVFSERAQFIVQGLPILSPTTATVTRATTFNSSGTCAPVMAGNTLFFPFSRGTFSGVREFYKTNENDINFDATESTLQVPKYIEGDVKTMTVSNHDDIMVIRAASSSTLYAYKFFRTPQGRVQSSWFTMSFAEANILEIAFLQQSLYMVIKRGTATYLEKMDLQTGKVDAGVTYVTALDRRVKVTPGSPGTTITLPTDYVLTSAEQAIVQVVSTDGEVMAIASATASSITLKEAYTGSESFYIGLPYTMRYELTKPTLKRPRETGAVETIATGRHQLRYMTVVYDDTAFFKVKVTPLVADADGTAVEYPFSGRFLSTGGFLGQLPKADGKFRFPVFAESDSVKIEIENDTPFPSNLQSIQFEAQYTDRTQRQ